jgi:outer membrane protein assembly factor BamB
MPSRSLWASIFDRGNLVGLWAFDSEDGTIVWNSFIKPNAALREAVRNTEVWVREQLGEARTFSLDSPKSRAPRLVEMRKAGIF